MLARPEIEPQPPHCTRPDRRLLARKTEPIGARAGPALAGALVPEDLDQSVITQCLPFDSEAAVLPDLVLACYGAHRPDADGQLRSALQCGNKPRSPLAGSLWIVRQGAEGLLSYRLAYSPNAALRAEWASSAAAAAAAGGFLPRAHAHKTIVKANGGKSVGGSWTNDLRAVGVGGKFRWGKNTAGGASGARVRRGARSRSVSLSRARDARR